MEVTFKVDEQQLKRLTMMLREFPDDVIAERRVIGGMKKAIKPMLKAAKNEVSFRGGASIDFGGKAFTNKSSGLTAKNLHVAKGRQSSIESPYVILRLKPKPGDKNPRRYQHNVILGTRKGERKSTTGFVIYGDDGRPRRLKRISHPGTDANPYIDQAWAQTRGRVVNGFVDSIAKDIKSFKRRNNMS